VGTKLPRIENLAGCDEDATPDSIATCMRPGSNLRPAGTECRRPQTSLQMPETIDATTALPLRAGLSLSRDGVGMPRGPEEPWCR